MVWSFRIPFYLYSIFQYSFILAEGTKKERKREGEERETTVLKDGTSDGRGQGHGYIQRRSNGGMHIHKHMQQNIYKDTSTR